MHDFNISVGSGSKEKYLFNDIKIIPFTSCRDSSSNQKNAGTSGDKL